MKKDYERPRDAESRKSNKAWRTNRHKQLNFISISLQSRRWAHIKRSARMETIGSIVCFAFATICAVFSIWHEVRWRKRLRAWNKTKGKVVGVAKSRPIKTLFGKNASNIDGPFPEIEFFWMGAEHKFISGYGGSAIPRVGSEVDIIIDPSSGDAEYLSFTNRWFGTFVPLIFSALFFWVTFQT